MYKSFFKQMRLSPLQLILIVLTSLLLGAIITFSIFHLSELKLVMGSLIFILSLLLVLLLQLRQTGTEQ